MSETKREPNKEIISFAIGIPTINRLDLLAKFLESYARSLVMTPIYIYDNGNQALDLRYPNVHIIRPHAPKSVAASWNALCQVIFLKNTHALILNDDIFLNKTDRDINEFIYMHRQADFFISRQNGWCSFILPKKTFLTIGFFDENFKGAYFEDRDYDRRMKIAKLDVISHAFLNPSIYNESSSIKKDKKLNANFQHNADYYQQKWGGPLGGEKFVTPFNK